MSSEIKIEGLDELIKDFTKLGDNALIYLHDSAAEATGYVLNKAQQKVPVSTGVLKKSLTARKVKKSKRYPYRVFGSVTFKPKGYYGVFVELGHKLKIQGNTVGTVKEKPFLRPAADESRSEVGRIIAKGLNKALEKFGGAK